MARLFKPWFLLFFILSPALPTASLNAESTEAGPHDYTAVYKVHRNDKHVGKVTIGLSHQDNLWTLHGFTHDMKGLAKVLKIKGTQTSTGTWENGWFLPENFKYTFSLIGFKFLWNSDFDWSSGIVTTSGLSGEKQLPLSGGALDPFSLSLNIRSLLAKNQDQMKVDIIDEDEFENHVYQAEPDDSFDSSLGCLKTTRVNRIRENSKRTSVVWYANKYDYIPVLMHHSKRKGNKLELHISSLIIEGQEISPASPCDSDSTEKLNAEN